jgi:NAD(P)H dehydrogenase (quinone)
MAKVLVAYYSRSGHTAAMAEAVAKGAAQAGASVECKSIKDVAAKELLKYDGIVLGSPTYYGTMAWELKKLLDDSVAFHGQLSGKVGGAFSSSGNIGGGNETTIMHILQALLIHGMVVQGSASGDHYGPVAIGAPDARSSEECLKLGRLVAQLAAKLHG